MKEPAILTLTPHGETLAHRLVSSLGRGEVISAEGRVFETLDELFQAGRPLVCVMALGIVVRILGPLAKNKETDPPVVVVDEAGQFAISVLGGHRGGANDLAKEVGQAIGAVPVITTASDSLGLPAVDLIGRLWDWHIENSENLTKVAAAVIRGETIGVYQDAGRTDWFLSFGPWPATFQRIESWPPSGTWPARLVISDRLLPHLESGPTIVYRPPSLVLGVGCRRGVSRDEIEEMFQDVCRSHGLSSLSLGEVATVSLKAGEPGLIGFASRRHMKLCSFSVDQLAAVGPLPTPSARVRSKIGIDGVAEPAAMLAAGCRNLIVTKQRGQRITMAIARRENP